MGACGTILVVDHDAAVRAAAVSIVERLGYLVCEAENAESVLERLDAESRHSRSSRSSCPDRRAAFSFWGSCTRPTATTSR